MKRIQSFRLMELKILTNLLGKILIKGMKHQKLKMLNQSKKGHW